MTRYTNEITRDHVGERIMVRRWIDDDGERVQSDVIGTLTGVDDGGCWHVEHEDGRTWRIDRATVVASKVLPPKPVRRPRPRTAD